MTIFKIIFLDKIVAKYSLKRTKLHHFKKFSRGSMPPNKRVASPRASCHALNTPTFQKNFEPPPPK